MATPKLTSIIFAILFLSSPLIPTYSREFSSKISKNGMGGLMKKRQKLSHLHFYLHDIVSGRNPTAVRVADAATSKSSATEFGSVFTMDDPLTEGPEMSSRIVGRAQGMYASADSSDVGLLMVVNFGFTEGKFNGSTLSILGRNAVFAAVRELPVVGGSGVFRLARGYARAKTHDVNVRRDAVVEYNVYVFHY